MTYYPPYDKLLLGGEKVMSAVTQKILKKLEHIESMQKELLQDWEVLEDFLFESASPRLKKEIRQGRKAYRAGKAIPYQQLRRRLGLA
ncbi:MAG: hypothetical protein GH147_07150 [Clostridia bacterium]|nr:hypothetical protein [Clostridia bacterium]